MYSLFFKFKTNRILKNYRLFTMTNSLKDFNNGLANISIPKANVSANTHYTAGRMVAVRTANLSDTDTEDKYIAMQFHTVPLYIYFNIYNISLVRSHISPDSAQLPPPPCPSPSLFSFQLLPSIFEKPKRVTK